MGRDRAFGLVAAFLGVSVRWGSYSSAGSGGGERSCCSPGLKTRGFFVAAATCTRHARLSGRGVRVAAENSPPLKRRATAESSPPCETCKSFFSNLRRLH